MPRLALRPGLLAALLPLVALPACEDDHDDDGTPSGATCPQDSTLTWENFGQAFMDTYCNRCHGSSVKGADRQGAPSDHNFDTRELVQEMIDHIDETSAAGPKITNTAMPIGAPTPTDEERRKLGEWLACDAP